MFENPVVIVLPVMAILIAGVSIFAAWYWWTSTSEDDEETDDGGAVPVKPAVTHSPLDVDESEGLFSRLKESFMPESGQPERTSSVQSSPPVGSGPPPPVGNAVEVMRIYRDLADGSLIVEIDGVRYRRLTEITDPETGRRFIGNANALARFARLDKVNLAEDRWQAEAAPPPTPAPGPPPVSPQPQVAPPPAAPPPGAPPIEPFEVGFIGGTEPIEEPRAWLFGGRRSEPEEEKPEPKTMADQIEELLQYRLTHHPEYAQRSIHIRSAYDGSVRIQVDERVFEGVGEVDDADIRDFIQSIIREWEARQ